MTAVAGQVLQEVIFFLLVGTILSVKSISFGLLTTRKRTFSKHSALRVTEVETPSASWLLRRVEGTSKVFGLGLGVSLLLGVDLTHHDLLLEAAWGGREKDE